MNTYPKWLAATLCLALCAALPNAYAASESSAPPVNKLPAAAAPPACVCTDTKAGTMIISNCQCGNTQCIAAIGASGAGSTSIACVK